MLVVPVSFFIEGAYDLTRGRVAARRIIDVLNLSPERDGSGSPDPAVTAELTDQISGLRAPGGRLLGLAAADPSDAIAITERLAGSQRLLLSTNDSYLFAGTVREVLQAGRSRTDAELWAALEVASADDVVMSLGEGELDAVVDAQGRNLSGGQRQRLRLARAIAVDPDLLILVEPTSAVDADTETRIVRRVARQRAGRTTVIASTSPIVLHHVDTVAFVAAGKVVAVGTHHDLLTTHPDYRAMVSRSLADEDELDRAEG
jgi:ABC-type glutathione transport system ATPase component